MDLNTMQTDADGIKYNNCDNKCVENCEICEAVDLCKKC